MAEWTSIKSLVSSITGKKEIERKLVAGNLEALSAQKELVVSKDQKITDSIYSQYDVSIYGTVIGDIISEQAVYVYGTVSGDIIAKDRIVLHAKSKVTGKLSASSLSVEHEAELCGRCEIA